VSWIRLERVEPCAVGGKGDTGGAFAATPVFSNLECNLIIMRILVALPHVHQSSLTQHFPSLAPHF
jgi:hypothetical protein